MLWGESKSADGETRCSPQQDQIPSQGTSHCTDHVKGIEVNIWASDIARDELPEPVVINLGSVDDDSATDTASENEDEI